MEKKYEFRKHIYTEEQLNNIKHFLVHLQDFESLSFMGYPLESYEEHFEIIKALAICYHFIDDIKRCTRIADDELQDYIDDPLYHVVDMNEYDLGNGL